MSLRIDEDGKGGDEVGSDDDVGLPRGRVAQMKKNISNPFAFFISFYGKIDIIQKKHIVHIHFR